MAGKSKRIKIRMNSTESSHFYTTSVNHTNKPEKLKLKKFDPVVRKHVVYEEGKIK